MVVDCHIHMALDGGYWKDALARHKEAPDEQFIRKTLETYKSLGFTYLRDGGDRWNAGKRASELAPEYGIRYRTPVFPIYRKGHYGSFIGRGFETLDDFRALISEVKTKGGHFIKIMISGLMDFNRYGVLTDEPMPDALIRELTNIAHGEGFSIMAHANGDAAVRGAVLAGIDSVEHGAYLTDETLQMLAESRTDARYHRKPDRRHALSRGRNEAASRLSADGRPKSGGIWRSDCSRQRRGRVSCFPRTGRTRRTGASARSAGRKCRRDSRAGHGGDRSAVLKHCAFSEGLIQ